MLPLAVSAFLFLALVSGAMALLAPARLGRSPTDERIRRLRHQSDEGGQRSASPTLRRGYSSIPTLRRLLGGSAWADAVTLELQQANVRLRVGEYLMARLLFAGLLFLLTVLIARLHPVGLALGLALAAGGYMAPALFVRHLRHRRIAAIEKQLVDFLPMIASSLRSGFAFLQGVELAARQIGPPLHDELSLLVNDMNLGATMEAALLDLGRRVGSTDVDMMVTAVLVQRTSGGNLSEILDSAAETLRERERIRGELQTLTAQQRLTGLILSVYPIAVGLLLLAIMPSMWSVLFTETLGRVFLGVALGLQFLGFFTMRRVMEIEI